MKAFNSKIAGSDNASPIDQQKNHQLVQSRSLYSFNGRAIDSPTLDPFDMDSALIRYSRSAAAAGLVPSSVNLFAPPAIDSGKFHQLLLHQHSNLSSSRGSSSSPLSAIENLETPPSRSPPMFSTPVKVEEDVLVMDGILVGSSPGSRARPAVESGSSYKTEICRVWEDSGSCRYGSKCQFAHGKEDLRPTRQSNKNKAEGSVCKTTATAGGSSSSGTKNRSTNHVAAEKAPAMKLEQVRRTESWSPLDDGIEVSKRPSASREAVDKYINNILYGPRPSRRLPVFTEICPE